MIQSCSQTVFSCLYHVTAINASLLLYLIILWNLIQVADASTARPSASTLSQEGIPLVAALGATAATAVMATYSRQKKYSREDNAPIVRKNIEGKLKT